MVIAAMVGLCLAPILIARTPGFLNPTRKTPAMWLYRALDRVFPTSFVAKFQALAVMGIALPFLVAVLFFAAALLAEEGVGAAGLGLLILCFGAGAAGLVVGVKHLLAPIEQASRAAQDHDAGRPMPTLPKTYQDEAGRLLFVLQRITERARTSVREAEVAADLDPLTKLFNRRGFEKRMDKQRASGLRGALLIVDVDHFRKVNDTHGHAVGDQVLVAVSEVIRDEIRGTDLVGRFGGEELVIFLSGATQPGAITRADAIREKVASLDLVPPGPLTATVGVAVAIGHKEEFVSLYGRADRALANAKREGRNQSRLANVTSISSD